MERMRQRAELRDRGELSAMFPVLHGDFSASAFVTAQFPELLLRKPGQPAECL